jgi:hypothetical protein
LASHTKGQKCCGLAFMLVLTNDQQMQDGERLQLATSNSVAGWL